MGSEYRFRVATYNIHKARGVDGRVRPQRILEVLNEVDADVIALQEVLSLTGHPPHKDQARYFSENLGMEVCFGQTRSLRGGIYGNIVLTRLPVRTFTNYDISVRWREQRGCLRADLQIGDNRLLHIFNVHLGTVFYERRTQARKLLRAEILHNPELTGARIILGDFNEWSPGFVTRLLRRHFQKAESESPYPLKTYPAFRPVLMLDHIYFDSAFQANHVRVHQTPAALRASDHLPLVADLELHAPAVI